MTKTTSFILAIALLLCFHVFIFAQTAIPSDKMRDFEKQRQDIEQKMKQMQQEELERLKKENPQLYQQRRDAFDRQTKISAILSSFHAKTLSESQVESQLYPLIKQDVQQYATGLGAEIQRVEKRLEFLRKVKSNPEILVKKRLDQLLGKSAPSPEEIY